MVAYSFKPAFRAPIFALEKQQTIRLPRKRHARPGEAIQHFSGPRMRPERWGASQCLAARDVRLDFNLGRVTIDDAFMIEGEDLDAFAIRDGFRPPAHLDIRPWRYMARWWAITHPGQPVFRGVLIDWGGTFVPVAP